MHIPYVMYGFQWHKKSPRARDWIQIWMRMTSQSPRLKNKTVVISFERVMAQTHVLCKQFSTREHQASLILSCFQVKVLNHLNFAHLVLFLKLKACWRLKMQSIARLNVLLCVNNLINFTVQMARGKWRFHSSTSPLYLNPLLRSSARWRRADDILKLKQRAVIGQRDISEFKHDVYSNGKRQKIILILLIFAIFLKSIQ